MRTVTDTADVSVIVPAHRAPVGVATCVSHLLDRWPNVEVVVGVGPDDTDTAEAARAAGAVVAIGPDGRTPTNLNAALEMAKGDVIVRCDVQARFPDGYIERAVASLFATGADNVGGIQHAVGTSPMQRAIAAAQSSRLGVGGPRYRVGGPPGPVDTVYLGTYRAETLKRLDGFDATLDRNQDYDLNWRIREQGGVVWFDPTLVVEYTPRASLVALARQYFDYGRGKRIAHRRSGVPLRPRQLAPPALVAALVASGVAAAAGAGLWAAVVPAAYLGTIFFHALVTAIRSGDPALLGTSAAMPIMHLSWALGFLRG